MKKLLFGALVALGCLGTYMNLRAVTYTQAALYDGTNLWNWVSSNSAAVSQMSLQNNGTTVLTVDPANGIMPLVSLVAALPACTSALKGAARIVTDGSTATTGGTLAGSGSTVVWGLCNGTNWIVN